MSQKDELHYYLNHSILYKQLIFNELFVHKLYLVKNNELSDKNIDKLLEKIPNNIEMTGYDRIIQRGISLGRQEGR